MMNINPNDPEHKELEVSATKWLEQNEFLCTCATYHEVMSENIQYILQQRHSSTALYIRGRADRLAIHKRLPIEFEYECKTHKSAEKDDLLIEMVPVAFHLAKSELGVRCLYIYRSRLGQEYGFWMHKNEMPKIREIHIPHRWNNAPNLAANFKHIAKVAFPNVPIQVGVQVRGTGDPYLIINRSEVLQLSDWHALVVAVIEKAQR